MQQNLTSQEHSVLTKESNKGAVESACNAESEQSRIGLTSEKHRIMWTSELPLVIPPDSLGAEKRHGGLRKRSAMDTRHFRQIG